DARLGIRREPGERERLLLGFGVEEARVRFMPTMPPIENGRGYVTLDRDRLVVVTQAGQVTAPEGGTVDIAGSVMVIPDVKVRPQPAEVQLRATGPITAALSLLDQPPLNVMRKSGRPVDLAEGRAEV